MEITAAEARFFSQAESLKKLTTAAGCDIEAYWPSLFASMLQTVKIEDLINNIGSGTGQFFKFRTCFFCAFLFVFLIEFVENEKIPTAPAAGGPVAAAPAGGAAAAAAPAAAKKEEKKEEEEEDGDMGFSLFD